MKRLRLLFITVAVGALALTACAEDDDGTVVQSRPDAGKPDTGGPARKPGGPDGGSDTTDSSTTPDASTTDGGVQDFSDFVKNLIDTQTNATSKPVAVDGAYGDRRSLADYPPAFFQ